MFEREDWTLFRTLETLGQKAGVPLRKLRALVVKELTDNALDSGAKVCLRDVVGCYVIDVDGPGIPGSAEDIARLFSIRRPLTSSKMVRVPSRGALGNGLRVVVGAVLASRGQLEVETRGKCYVLTPRDDGRTTVTTSEAPWRTEGTLVRVSLGSSIPRDENPLGWGRLAAVLGQSGKVYRGQTSPHWYSADAFFEMLQASNERPLVDLLAIFRDVKGNTARTLSRGMTCDQVDRDGARVLLDELRSASDAPKPASLGSLGRDALGDDHAYAKEEGTMLVGSDRPATIPYVVEVFARQQDGDGDTDTVLCFVNRTPITGDVSVWRHKSSQVAISGCGLRNAFEVGRKPVALWINVTAPYMPITTDGKEPDLHRVLDPLYKAIKDAARRAKRKAAPKTASGRPVSQRDIIVWNLDDAIEKASGGGQYPYSLRQLFYAVRPYMLEELGKEPDYTYFANVITDVEAERGDDLPGIYRDPRGVLYHPHTGEEIPLGTLAVREYRRPDWTFNKILYSEKEGFFSILKGIQWPERNDCALMTSKGFASRAARDVIDLIGETQEEIYFFCIHDADASGTKIFESLTEATRARGKRKVHVINLGLEPAEAVAMNLQVETFRDDIKRRLPVADYVPHRWAEWLQTKRVELNAMTTPDFISWLDAKMAGQAGKVVPPTRVLREHLEVTTRREVRAALAEKILREHGLDAKVEDAMNALNGTLHSHDPADLVRDGLEIAPADRWDAPLMRHARSLAKTVA